MTDTDNVKAVGRQVRRDVGHVEILINNAGVMNGGALLKMRENDIKRLFEINTISHFWVWIFIISLLPKCILVMVYLLQTTFEIIVKIGEMAYNI